MDGTGETLLPGLFDMHVHVQPLDGFLNIASGVASNSRYGTTSTNSSTSRTKWDSGTAIGLLRKAGFIDGRGPFQAPNRS